MGFRMIILSEKSDINCHSGYLVVNKAEEVKRIHLSEIDAIIIENEQVRLTGVLINRIISANIALLLCDNRHDPVTLFQNINGHHRRSQQIKRQMLWTDAQKGRVWQFVIRDKIRNQRHLLHFFNIEEELLLEYENSVEFADYTNREGMAAKVYFNRLFGDGFTRNAENERNWALNYGYSLLLMYVTRTLAGKGYLPELGIKHDNEYNSYNLSCDLMEPFRPIIDLIVKKYIKKEFAIDEKRKLQQLPNMKVMLNGKQQYVPQAIEKYVQKCLDALNSEHDFPVVELDLTPISLYEF